MSCKTKVNKINNTLGKCSKCDATVKFSKCTNNSSAKIVVAVINHANLTLATAFSDVTEAVVWVDLANHLQRRNRFNNSLH